jgi:molecular chaperone GrpE (heat shock protein)
MNHSDSLSKRFGKKTSEVDLNNSSNLASSDHPEDLVAEIQESTRPGLQEQYDLKVAELTQTQKDLLYARAELQNQAMWCQRKIQEAATQGKLTLLRELIGPINTLIFLRLALQSTLANQIQLGDSIRELIIGSYDSIELVLKELEKLGIQVIEDGELGHAVDPHRHEVIQTIHGTMLQDHTVSIVVSRGFQYQGQLVQKAKVIAYRYEKSHPETAIDETNDRPTETPIIQETRKDSSQSETGEIRL